MFDASLPFSDEVGTSLDVNSNGIHREAAAIFLSAIRADGYSDRHIVRTIVHEIGHVFNLPHHRDKSSFMAETRPKLPESAFREFGLDEQIFLSNCSNSLVVQPGGKPFNSRGSLSFLVD